MAEATSSRGQNPAQQILQALRNINTTLTQGARDRTLGASAFNDMACGGTSDDVVRPGGAPMPMTVPS